MDGDLLPVLYVVIAFLCTIGSIALAILHIYKHLLNYTEPIYQRFIIRIIFMVSVYALMSLLSLIVPEASTVADSFKFPFSDGVTDSVSCSYIAFSAFSGVGCYIELWKIGYCFSEVSCSIGN